MEEEEIEEIVIVNSSRFAKYYNTKFPLGKLFYPSCGSDTIFPIRFLWDSVSEFHFADAFRPQLKIPGEFKNHVEGVTRINFPQNVRMIDSPFPSIGSIAIRDEREIYGVHAPTHPKKTFKIFVHELDGFLTLLTIDKISIFFYRGDSPGEGGSGQWWFGDYLFNLLLSKMTSGGLIITDGSNFTPNHCCPK